VLAGKGPALLLLHGLGCDHTTWSPVIARLSRRFTVIAPDLLGHGASDKPRADYTLGGYANGMRDLLAVLGIDRVTVVGHSFGGGVAMQFAYQFPQHTERLMLIAPGGIGREVNPILRALTLPGAGAVLAIAATAPVFGAVRLLGACARAARLPGTADIPGAMSVLAGKQDARERDAFLHVLRAVVDGRGQVVTMTDRAYLASNMPTCVMWGERDTVLPVRQAETARRIIPGVRIEIVPGGGHFPHEEFPDRFASVLTDFVRSTPASRYDATDWRSLLRAGGESRRSVPARSGADVWQTTPERISVLDGA
jgi:pimeloyl-ACP methyl ester carboxylesterase